MRHIAQDDPIAPLVNRRLFLLGGAAALATPALARAPSAPPRAVAVRGLSGPVEILDDAWGVPHVRAGTIPDAFFGQGYAVARDRLFQIDLGHRREMGRMAEAYGPDFARFDAAARLFHYRGDPDRELARVPAAVLACARAYIAGVNARVDAVLADAALLPREYAILGAQPMRWELRDLVIARGGGSGNAGDEVRRARLAAMGLLDLDAIVAPLRPAHALAVPDGLDAAAVTEADLGVLRLGALPFGPDTPVADPAEAEAAEAGSNAWTVAGSRTATGRPILANDPHLGIGGFGPRHVAHLSAPGLDVIGGGAPGLPGIMQGHTDRFAFGRTNFHIDQGDLFVLELHPQDPERYRHRGRWKRFDRVEIEIPVKDAPPQRQTLRYAAQGPVVSHQPDRSRAVALASIAMQPGGSGAFAMIAINLARGRADLHRAFRLHPSPTNFHYADVDGTTGWQVIGFQPRRARGDGLMPVPGDGRYDWRGYTDHRRLPSAWNPPQGWFASANQNNLPPGWPASRVPAYSFRDPYRYRRIADALARQPRHALSDSWALQHDALSTPALELKALLPRAPSPAARPATAMLATWDGRLNGASPAAALFQFVWRDLSARMLAAIVPDRARSLVTEIAPSVLLERLAADPAMLDASLAAGWAAALAGMGPPASWRWDRLHRVRIRHPLSSIPAIAAAFPPIDGLGSGGDSYTVMARWLGKSDWRVGGGASYLQVIDVGNWDASMMLNLPGQSNDPASAHYRDQAAPWADGRPLPMPFSRAAVDAAARTHTVLRPAP